MSVRVQLHISHGEDLQIRIANLSKSTSIWELKSLICRGVLPDLNLNVDDLRIEELDCKRAPNDLIIRQLRTLKRGIRRHRLILNVIVTTPVHFEHEHNVNWDAVETGSSKGAQEQIPPSLLEILNKESYEVVPKLAEVMGDSGLEEILSEYFGQSKDGASNDDQANRRFYQFLCANELDHYFEEKPLSSNSDLPPGRISTFGGLPFQYGFGEDTAASDTDSVMSYEATPGTNPGYIESTAALNAQSAPSAVFECPLCYDDFPVASVFEAGCQNRHVCCYDCAHKHINVMADDGSGEIPCFGGNCEHKMSLNDIGFALGRGDFFSGQADPVFEQIIENQLQTALAANEEDYARCPRDRCNAIVARSETGAIEKVVCQSCNHVFCSSCREMYHYRSTCKERDEIKNTYRQWILSGRSVYWHAENTKNAKHHAAERRRVEQVIKEEAKDEAWKAQNCRICPHCSRVVNKIDGCDYVYCGRDAHFQNERAVNVQQGCGNKFYFSQAEPYVAVKAGKHVKLDFQSAKINKPLHFGKCDACDGEIRGLRFECIHCPCYCLCERCEQQGTNHRSDHVFKIHSESS